MNIVGLQKTVMVTLAVFMLAIGLNVHASAGEIRVAVASNFSDTIKALAHSFEKQTGHHVVVVVGSTGKHYAQIVHGAPYDAFFAADIERPQRLEREGYAIPSTRFTYAIGKLVLWSPNEDLVDESLSIFQSAEFRYLAIANPKLAPYGLAAKDVLQAKGLWASLQTKMVRGENIGQTYQFVKSGNAELGFVAYTQVKNKIDRREGSVWMIPQSLYTPIEQQAVLLKSNPVARSFLSFVKSEESKIVIQRYGYGSL
ncbi:molybdate ABC transporter substrate-binding protein [Alkalimarinus alittae]|uniref:Molybdate ABC transporter substrate-binding protein n=1 Tax=Alkalimarinus alittae TaxID=2961619 RepID=A0ABY6N5U7_9ALTE|nr:molybdate ABC transporter substrate-binding protein [Alkalimarinus alittae]UZE97369.1 molybdate ABC transporter substrate-binding protein [Alkalimarinus alittae]